MGPLIAALRCWLLCARAVGVLKGALAIAIRYSSQRQQFGPPDAPEVAVLDYPSQQASGPAVQGGREGMAGQGLAAALVSRWGLKAMQSSMATRHWPSRGASAHTQAWPANRSPPYLGTHPCR